MRGGKKKKENVAFVVHFQRTNHLNIFFKVLQNHKCKASPLKMYYKGNVFLFLLSPSHSLKIFKPMEILKIVWWTHVCLSPMFSNLTFCHIYFIFYHLYYPFEWEKKCSHLSFSYKTKPPITQWFKPKDHP